MTTTRPLARPPTVVLVLAVALVTAPVVLQHSRPSSVANPFYCVIIKDRHGNPIDTICVPWIFRGLETDRSAAATS